MAGNPEDRFSHDEAHTFDLSGHDPSEFFQRYGVTDLKKVCSDDNDLFVNITLSVHTHQDFDKMLLTCL